MKYHAEIENINCRLDTFITEMSENISRSKIQTLIKNGNVLVNGKLQKSSYKINEGDIIDVFSDDLSSISIEPQKIDLNIVYEDDNMLVVNKPSGMLTHPTMNERDNTLVNALLYKYGNNLSDINGEFRRGILHRLDRNTSGLLMIAKNNKSHEFLANQIKTKTALRSYLAITRGVIKSDDGIIDLPIARNTKNPEKMSVVENGKPSITEYHVIERFQNYTYVELTLKTGRTHQIRVHLSYTGTPVFNDTLYGMKKLEKIKTQEQVLQAYKLRFTKPFTNEIIQLEIEPDEKISRVLKYLRGVK